MCDLDLTDFLAPYPARRVRGPVVVQLTAETFRPEPTPPEAWLPVAFRAFARLADGSGARSPHRRHGQWPRRLGAAEIVPLRSVVATDLHAEGVAVARANVVAHLAREP